jgi:hypothetical protein
MDLPWRLFAGIVLLWLLVGIVPLFLSGDVHAAAEFASTFEFVNALFAALAFGGVIWAIRLQTKELELQRLEVEETRDELRRAADAQTLSQEMHFLSALLAARNNVAQGHAVAAEREQGALRLNHVAHRQHLAELEWLLQQVDRHRSNPFALPAPSVLAAHQLGMILGRAHQPLQLALTNRAINHLRSLLLNLGEALRELRRMVSGDPQGELSLLLDRTHAQVESATTIDDFADMAQLCLEVYGALRGAVATQFTDAPPELGPAKS